MNCYKFGKTLSHAFKRSLGLTKISDSILKMKVYSCLLVFLMHLMHANANFTWFSHLQLGPACITLTQLYDVTKILCAQKDNTDLWEKVIRCHDPMTEKVIFLFP